MTYERLARIGAGRCHPAGGCLRRRKSSACPDGHTGYWRHCAGCRGCRSSHGNSYPDTGHWRHRRGPRGGHARRRPHTDGAADADVCADGYSNAHTNPNADACADGYPNAHTNPDADGYSNAHTNPDADACADGYSDTHTNPNATTDAYFHADAPANPNPHAGTHANQRPGGLAERDDQAGQGCRGADSDRFGVRLRCHFRDTGPHRVRHHQSSRR